MATLCSQQGGSFIDLPVQRIEQVRQCPLYPQKRTSLSVMGISRIVPKAFCAAVKNVVIRSPRQR
jgi:hypothetical protein